MCQRFLSLWGAGWGQPLLRRVSSLPPGSVVWLFSPSPSGNICFVPAGEQQVLEQRGFLWCRNCHLLPQPHRKLSALLAVARFPRGRQRGHGRPHGDLAPLVVEAQGGRQGAPLGGDGASWGAAPRAACREGERCAGPEVSVVAAGASGGL